MTLRVLFVASGLGLGGAEASLLGLAGTMRAMGHVVHVVSLRDDMPMERQFLERGISPTGCGVDRHPLRGLRAATHACAGFEPDVIQGWMYHGNLAAHWIRWRVARRVPIAWSVRHHVERLSDETMKTALLIWGSSHSFARPDLVMYNSAAGCSSHARFGYRRFPSVVIPNGVDAARFVSSTALRNEWRTRHGVSQDEPVIGLVARFHAAKDLATFCATAARIRDRYPRARFVLAGTGMSTSNMALRDMLTTHSIADRTLLVGPVEPERVYPALDVFLLTSRTEAVPNVLLEAMCCGVPCVATDVGDCARVVADAEAIAPVGDVMRLADACARFVSMTGDQHDAYVARNRDRMIERYTVAAMVDAYVVQYHRLIAERTRS